MRTLLHPGLLRYAEFQKIARDTNEAEVTGVLVRDFSRAPDWHPSQTGIPTWTARELFSVDPVESTPTHHAYDEVLRGLLRDPRAFYLLERAFGFGGSSTVFNHAVRLEQMTWQALGFLDAVKPDQFVSTNTPHDVFWFVARIAELLGIDVYLAPASPLPWRSWIVKGMDEQTPLKVPTDDFQAISSTPSPEVEQHIRKCRSDYDVAIPDYERERKERYRGKLFDVRLELQAAFRSRTPSEWYGKIRKAAAKRSILKAYETYSRHFQWPDEYVVLFLHYQPERTTLPEGLWFAQQWMAIRCLAQALPRRWKLVVREHPSMYRHVFTRAVRTARFYHSINALPNATLAPMGLSPFVLIDRSKAVATITGTVGVEALIRGRPVIVFGTAQYRDAQGVFAVGDSAATTAALEEIERGCELPSEVELNQYFAAVEQNSFQRCEQINSSLEAMRLAITDGWRMKPLFAQVPSPVDS